MLICCQSCDINRHPIDSIYRDDFGHQAGDLYHLKRGTTLWHGTQAFFKDGNPNKLGTWFCLDPDICVKHILSGFHGGATALTNIKAWPVLIKYKLKKPLNVKIINPKSRDHCQVFKESCDDNSIIWDPAQSGLPHDCDPQRNDYVLASSITTETPMRYCKFCDVYNGWRAPWDEDEVMICTSKLKDYLIEKGFHIIELKSTNTITIRRHHTINQVMVAFHAIKDDPGLIKRLGSDPMSILSSLSSGWVIDGKQTHSELNGLLSFKCASLDTGVCNRQIKLKTLYLLSKIRKELNNDLQTFNTPNNVNFCAITVSVSGLNLKVSGFTGDTSAYSHDNIF